MSDAYMRFTNFMFGYGGILFIALGLIFLGMLGYALLCAADEDEDYMDDKEEEEKNEPEHDD